MRVHAASPSVHGVKWQLLLDAFSFLKSLPKAIYSADHYQTQRAWVLWLQKNIFTSLDYSYKKLHWTKDGQQGFTLIAYVHLGPFSGSHLVPLVFYQMTAKASNVPQPCAEADGRILWHKMVHPCKLWAVNTAAMSAQVQHKSWWESCHRVLL